MEIKKNITKSVLIVTFSGRQQGIATMTIFEFTKFLEDQYPTIDKLFLKDEKVLWYNFGITGISENVEETVLYLKEYIKEYENVVFIGASMGGYAALLYGSILNVKTVIAFRPQTFLDKVLPDYSSEYCDVKKFINNTTQYYVYGDSSLEDENDIHSIKYCDHIDNFNNLNVIRIPNFDIKEYKDKGLLKKDFKKYLN